MYKKWNKSSFRRSVGRALGDGLLKRVEYGFGLTVDGEKRLLTILPDYKRTSSWDGKLWLITYDIASDKRRTRDKFRKWLIEIGCRMIQESVWLSIKDPTPWIKNFLAVSKKRSIIISCLGKDGSVGSENLSELLNRVFELNKLNNKYIEWIESSEKYLNDEERKLGLGFRYLSLLKSDPMFPKELLSPDWAGGKAMDLFDKQYRSELDISQYFNTRV